MTHRTLLALLLLPAGACMDVPEYERDPAPEPGEGEGEQPPAEGEGEGEGEGPAEGEGEGEPPAEGEGEEPLPPPTVERALPDLELDGSVSGVDFTSDDGHVGVFRPYGRVQLYALDGSGLARTIDVDDADGDDLFRGFALSPTLPLAVTLAGSSLQTWSLEGEGDCDYLTAWSPDGGFSSDARFNSAGNMVVILGRPGAIVVRVAGGISEETSESYGPEHAGHQAVFVGPDDLLVVLQDPETANLRLQPTKDGGPAGGSRTPRECGGITAIAGARNVDLLAFLCDDGSAWVTEVSPWGEPRPFRARLGTLDSVALSPDGQLLAATEGERLNVFDTATGGRATIEVGEVDDHYGRGAAFSPGSRLLALDRKRRVVVLRVEPAVP